MLTRRTFLTAASVTIAMPAILRHRKAWAAAPRVRRNASTMAATDPFFSDYAQAVEAMHKSTADKLGWRNQALIHMNFCKHGATDFAHWHRWYISFYEQICGKLIGKQDFALAYWDWEEAKSKLPEPFFDVEHLNVAFWKDKSDVPATPAWPAPVKTVGARGIAKGQTMVSMPQFSRSFLKSTLDNIRVQSSFAIFTNLLEGQPHNNTHRAVGSTNNANGHMGAGMSPLDPVFWLHHCNVDRFWAEWQAAGNVSDDPNSSYANNFIDADGKAVADASSTGALSIASFGYTYDTLEPAVVAKLSEELELKSFAAAGGSLFANRELTSPAPIGKGAAPGPATVNVERAIPVEVPDLVKTLSEVRFFRAPDALGVPRNALEPRRIVARLEGVETPKDRNIVVGVFVNCPYLSPTTPSDDQHGAGVFSFFVPDGDHGGHAGSKDVYVDLTDTLRTLAGDGRLAGNGFKVQLMAVPIADDVPADTSIGLKSVTILSA